MTGVELVLAGAIMPSCIPAVKAARVISKSGGFHVGAVKVPTQDAA